MFRQNSTANLTIRSVSLPLLLFSLTAAGLNCQTEYTPKQPELVFDFDLDGVTDQDDLDDDNDGIPDEIETTFDLDGDKIPNHQDRDSDGDGINDLIEALGVDKDGDGTVDPWDEWIDSNHNGFHDEYEAEPLVILTMVGAKKVWQSKKSFSGIALDQDDDQIPNFWDLDSDNDGRSDFEEWAGKNWTSESFDTNADGFNDGLVGHIYTQGDKEERSGHPENEKDELGQYQSIYVDGTSGYLNGNPDLDDNGNGIPDFFDKL